MAKRVPTEIKNNVVIYGWKVGKHLGEGGQGSVWEVRPVSGHAPPGAIKVCLSDDPKARRRFEREVAALGKFDHPGIVRLRGANTDWKCAPDTEIVCGYYVTDRYQGALKETTWWKDAPLYSLQVFKLVCEAVHYVHEQGDFHRDLKPQNILFDPNSERSIVAVTDFGTVTGNAEEPVTEVHEVVGTRYYRAPECHKGKYTERSDIYSLGRILGWMLTGTDPDDPSPATIPDTSPLSDSARAHLNLVIKTACAFKADDRYNNVAELIAALPTLVGDLVADAQSPVHQDASSFYSEVKNTLRNGVSMDWQDLRKEIPNQTRTNMADWDRENDPPSRGTTQDLLAWFDTAIVRIAQPLAFSLASLESPTCRMEDVVFPLLEDILQVFPRRGPRTLPSSLLSVVHSLVGASLVMTNRFESIELLARRKITLPGSTDNEELWDVERYFPRILVAEYREGWQFLFSLPERHPWLKDVYGSLPDFQRYLMGYWWALSAIELAAKVKVKPALLDETLPLHELRIRVHPHMLLESPAMVRRSFDEVLGDPQKWSKLLEAAQISDEDFRKAWPHWGKSLVEFAGALSGSSLDKEIPTLPV